MRWVARSLLHVNLEVEQEANRLALDRLHHALIQSETFALILDERITLRHGAQADALLEVIHLIEVIAPAAVNHRKHNTTLEFTHGKHANRALTTFVSNARIRHHLTHNEVAVDATLGAGLGNDLVDGD